VACPSPRDLRRTDVDGQVIISVGSAVLFSYDAADAVNVHYMGPAWFLTYLGVLVLVHHSTLPRTARNALRFVTPAVLAAIILPAVMANVICE